MNNISIQNESTEFLRLQAIGNCNNSCRKRLTKLSLANSVKEQLAQVYTLVSDVYFGITQSSIVSQNIKAIEAVLNSIREKVSQCEQDLIDYIWMVVHGDKNNVAIQQLQRHYNSSIENTY